MLFNSEPFLFGFLPAVLLVHLLVRRNPAIAAWWLGLASLGFYSWWNWRFIFLLLLSIAVNYGIGGLIAARRASARPAGAWLGAGIGFDLGLLIFFKYLGFLTTFAGWRLGFEPILPLGISFYTFTQIAFLVDLARAGDARPKARDYLLFVGWFPHLIAGPILHHREMIPQFGGARAFRAGLDDIAAGLTMLAIGLFKKVVLADGLAPHVGPVFDQPGEPSALSAWVAVLAYSLELYFDFSGYCDMAIGLSRLFGLRLPLNFDSPYQATSLIEFWRRWHMTLARFLRDYLYIPLGGSRSGLGRWGNILITMALGGLWHGAGWNYLVWGLLHGVFLCVNHLWRALGFPRTRAGWPLTLLAVILAWVPFRAPSLGRAGAILAGMAGGNGLGDLDAGLIEPVCRILALGAVVLFAPNSQAILAAARPALGAPPRPAPALLTWRLSPGWAGLAGLALAASLVRLGQPSPFLYFQF
jgi:alginate O-acetyltransferase complex protein AlgI